MKNQVEQQFTIANLGCAHCASKMENAINNDYRISSASINFMQSSLLVSYKEEHFTNEQELYDVLTNYIKKYEPSAYLTSTPASGNTPVKEYHPHCGDEYCVTIENPSRKKSQFTKNPHPLTKWIKLLLPWVMGTLLSLIGAFMVTNQTARLILILLGYLILGYDVLLDSFKKIRYGSIFDENLLMIVATFGALYVGKYTEAIAVLLLFQIGEFLQSLAVDRSKRNLADAMNLKALFANVETPSGLHKVPPEKVMVGDILVIKPSEKVALDGIVVEGTSFLDTSSLTGESVPRKASVGDEILSGCINGHQTLKVKVTKPYQESTVAKVLDMVEHASNRKSHTENFITKFARVYTPAVVILAILIASIPPVITRTWEFSKWIYIACSFLVVSCPCALVISVPLGFFGGIGCASKNGILVKGSNYLEGLTTLRTVVFDKTGTLTKGSFKVKDIKVLTSMEEDSFLAIAALLESYSTHPIAVSIVETYKERFDADIDTAMLKDYKEISGNGVQATIEQETYYLGNKHYMDSLGILKVPSFIDTIGTIAYLAKRNECIGYLTIADEIKDDAKDTITALKRADIRTVLFTGDTEHVAKKVANPLGIDTVYAELLPTDKVTKLEELMEHQSSKETMAFIGDGINDAPVIARSDIGIAMGGVGSDAAIEAADIVLMTDEPSKISKAIAIARRTKQIVTINIIFSLVTKLIVLLLLVLGYGTMWFAIFADVGVSLLAILNSIRTLHIKCNL